MAERDAEGKFTAGHKGLGGRPPEAKRFVQQIKDATSDEDREEIFVELIARCKAGSLPAMRLLFSYLGGLPRQTIDIDADVRTNVAYLEALDRVTGTPVD